MGIKCRILIQVLAKGEVNHVEDGVSAGGDAVAAVAEEEGEINTCGRAGKEAARRKGFMDQGH